MYVRVYVLDNVFRLLFLIALVITNGPMDVTVCSGAKVNISCGFTGVPNLFSTRPNWRIIRRNNDGEVISNETVNAIDILNNVTDGLKWNAITTNNGNEGFLSVGPVDETYNKSSYQCIFTINDTIIESDTVGTITVIGMYVTTIFHWLIAMNTINFNEWLLCKFCYYKLSLSSFNIIVCVLYHCTFCIDFDLQEVLSK